MLGELAGPDLLRQLARDDDPGRPGIEQQRHRGAIIQPHPHPIPAMRQPRPHRQQFQLDLRALHLARRRPDLSSRQRLQQVKVFTLMPLGFRVIVELRQVLLQGRHVLRIRPAQRPFIHRVAILGIKLVRPGDGNACLLAPCMDRIHFALAQPRPGALAVQLERGLVFAFRRWNLSPAKVNVAARGMRQGRVRKGGQRLLRALFRRLHLVELEQAFHQPGISFRLRRRRRCALRR